MPDKELKRVKLEMVLDNCMDCPHHEVVADPDPMDSFNADDVAVICKKSPTAPNKRSSHAADHHPFRKSAVACRPYNTRNEATVPDWCPLPEVKEKASSKGRR
jgi:hypothetical protein